MHYASYAYLFTSCGPPKALIQGDVADFVTRCLASLVPWFWAGNCWISRAKTDVTSVKTRVSSQPTSHSCVQDSVE